MSKARDKEEFWQEFERELAEAIEQDKTMTKKERRVWLNTLPEHRPLAENMVRVIFMGMGKNSGHRPRKSGGRD